MPSACGSKTTGVESTPFAGAGAIGASGFGVAGVGVGGAGSCAFVRCGDGAVTAGRRRDRLLSAGVASVGNTSGGSLSKVVVRIRVGTTGNANAVAATSSIPATPTDVMQSVETIAMAMPRDQIGAMNR